MNLRLKTVYVEEVRRSSDITFLVPVCPCDSVEICHQYVVPNVEFSIVVEERSINVHLDDESSVTLAIFCCLRLSFLRLFQNTIEFIDFIDYGNPSTLIRILSRFDNPYIPHLLACIYLFLLFPLNLFLSFLVIFDKSAILRILEPVFDMKCQRNILKHISFFFLKKFLQIVKKGLLVSQVEVVFQMAVHNGPNPVKIVVLYFF
jgi:hypothetical protein